MGMGTARVWRELKICANNNEDLYSRIWWGLNERILRKVK